MGFTSLTTKIIATIQAATAVSSLVTNHWPGKTLSVKAGFKTRQEINVSELPICLIVRPDRKMNINLSTVRQYEHDFILFVGVHCETRESAPGWLDDLENAIEDALVANPSLTGTAVDVNFIGSSNDMGMYHPVYFTSMQFQVLSRK